MRSPDITESRSLQPKGDFHALSWICRCPRSHDGRFIPLLSSGLVVVAVAMVVMLISIVGTYGCILSYWLWREFQGGCKTPIFNV